MKSFETYDLLFLGVLHLFHRISFEKEIPSGASQAGQISQSYSLRDADYGVLVGVRAQEDSIRVEQRDVVLHEAHVERVPVAHPPSKWTRQLLLIFPR